MQKFLTGALAAVSTARPVRIHRSGQSGRHPAAHGIWGARQQALPLSERDHLIAETTAFWSLPFFWRSIWSGSCAGICASGTRQTVSTGR